MARTPEEVYTEIAAWPLEARLRLAARLLEAGAAELARAAPARLPAPPPRPPSGQPAGSRESLPDPSASIHPAPGRSSVKASGRATAAGTAGRAGGPAAAKANGATEPRRLVLLDGSNFLGTVPGFDLATEAARDELITRLQDFAHAHPSTRVVVYFDGRKTSVKRAGGVEVRFSPAQKPADFYILEAIRAMGHGERQRTVLVTADRALGEAAQKLGAKVEAPASFHHRLPGLRRSAIGERGLSAAEVADWEAYFQQPPQRGPRD